jgi:tetratricopeptide (TPR) repeat protein
MAMNEFKFQPARQIYEAAKQHAKADARVAVAELVQSLSRSKQAIDDNESQRIMLSLLDQRWFDLASEVGGALVKSGLESRGVKRRYAQALIDSGVLGKARSELEKLAKTTGIAPSERSEIVGLIGRVQKQIYINDTKSRGSGKPSDLKQAIQSYLKGYKADPDANTWHGINAVALLMRAEKDALVVAGVPDAEDLANQIVNTIHVKQPLNRWDYATAGEACIALNRYDEATQYLKQYAWHPDVNAFSLGSTLRQLEEVWNLHDEGPAGEEILTLLRARLLELENGSVNLAPAVVNGVRVELAKGGGYEKVFGADHFTTYEKYLVGLERCQMVARIGKEISRGEGTGFVMFGSDLSDKLPHEPVLVTNCHVVDPEGKDGLHPDDVVICFHAMPGVAATEVFKVDRVLEHSKPDALDFSVLKLNRPVPVTKSYPLAPTLPTKGSRSRVFVIGHPGGGALSYSLNDNELLDYDDVRLHYRAPTEGGSSGSPVFNQDWKLIGLHHVGKDDMPRLHGQPGTYQANEGIIFRKIAEAVKK